MADTWIKDRHDIGITNDNSGDLIGMMLAEQNGVPAYAVYDRKNLADQFFTGAPDQRYQDPEEELPIYQNDWRSGFGLEYSDVNDPKRYYYSDGMDMRFRGRMLAGPTPTTVTTPGALAPSVANAGMENWTGANLDDWTVGAGTVQKEAAVVHGGAASALINAGNGNFYQDITWDSDYQGRRVTYTSWVWAGVANTAKIRIDDGVGTTDSGFHTGGAGWEQLSVTMTLALNATRYRIINICTAANNGIYDDAATTTLSAPGNDVVTWAEFNDELYAAFGTVLAKLDVAGTTFKAIYEFTADITDLEPFTDDNLYIALGTSNDYWYMSTAEALTESNAAIKQFQYFKTIHGTTPSLWGNNGVNTLYSTTDPTNGGAAWGGLTTVGSSYNVITGLLTRGGLLYVMKEDIPYYIDSAGAVQNDLAPELGALSKSTDNGKNSTVWLDYVYMPWGDQSLLETDGTTNSWRNPADFCTNLADFNDQVMAVAGDDRYLHAVLKYGVGTVYILAGRQETIDGSTSWVWHPIAKQTSMDGCNSAFVSGVVTKRLWFSSTDASHSLYYIPLPDGYGDIEGDANRKFKTDVEMHTSFLDGGFRDDDKGFYKIEALLGHAYDTDIYFECYYKKLGDATWTSVGDLKGTTSNRRATLYIPVDGSGNDPVSTMMKFGFVAKTDTTNTSPSMLSFKVFALLYPTQRNVIAATIRCANNLETKQGGAFDKAMAPVIKDTLERARQATWPITIKDIDGDTKTVKFLPLPKDIPQWVIVKDEKGRVKERHFNVLMMEVTLS